MTETKISENFTDEVLSDINQVLADGNESHHLIAVAENPNEEFKIYNTYDNTNIDLNKSDLNNSEEETHDLNPQENRQRMKYAF